MKCTPDFNGWYCTVCHGTFNTSAAASPCKGIAPEPSREALQAEVLRLRAELANTHVELQHLLNPQPHDEVQHWVVEFDHGPVQCDPDKNGGACFCGAQP